MKIEGEVSNPISFTVKKLQKMESVDLYEIPHIYYSGRQAENSNSFRGVLLRNLLEDASIRCADDRKRSRLYLVAYATDGHAAVFSFNEVFNSASSGSIIVAYEKNGRPISAPEGQMVLVSASDLKTGCRYLKAISRIEVREAL